MATHGAFRDAQTVGPIWEKLKALFSILRNAIAESCFNFRRKKKKSLAPFQPLAYILTVRENSSPPKNMTKKHFIHAAKLISCIPNMEEKIAAARVFYQVAESDNPNFDRERFLTACGISGK